MVIAQTGASNTNVYNQKGEAVQRKVLVETRTNMFHKRRHFDFNNDNNRLNEKFN